MMVSVHPTLRWQDLRPHQPEWDTLSASGSQFHYTYNARAGLYQLLLAMPRSGGRDTVLLPAFHCTTVVEPVLRAGWKVRFYRIKSDLSVDLVDLECQLSSEIAVVLVIHFLGFPAPLENALRISRHFGCYLIEDWAHSFLRGPEPHLPGDQGDFALFSFYKHTPSFAGGGLRVNVPIPWSMPLQKSVGAPQTARIFKRLFEQAIENSSSRPLKAPFQKFEQWRVSRKRLQSADAGKSGETFFDTPYEFSEPLARAGMPWLCRQVIHASRWASLFQVRRRNYEYLAQNLKENSWLRKVHPVLPADVCPWAFPVWMGDRAKQDVQLRACGVPLFTFGETLHPQVENATEAARKDARELSQKLLLLSVHQNLELTDMQHSVQIVNQFYSRVV
jgi:dTDP-4-amino-4,6-dideoxygalactose transaminase